MTTQVVAAGQERGAERSNKLKLAPLIALVVGSMIGGGVFNLPSDMSRSAGPGAIVIGWVITGIGMLMLAFVCQGLALRKPRLGAGSYSCAKAACRGSSSTSRARREAGARTFSAPEAVIAAAILALGSCAAWLLWTERISPF